MKYPKIPLAQTVVQLCKAKAIRHIVISPGSRNAPLSIGFTNDTYFTCYSIVDERCAAFFAMGLAQQHQYPTVVVCTSGSALLNYYPAVAEAFYSTIPLVVISADRPEYLVGIGDGQTIHQPNVYGCHSLYAANLKQDINLEKAVQESKEEILPIMKSIANKRDKFLELEQGIQEYNEHHINKALNSAIVQQGPVHLNCPFDEPLYDTLNAWSITPKVSSPIQPKKEMYHYPEFANIWNTAQRKLLIVGVNFPNTVSKDVLEFLALDESVVVLTETTSNIHHQAFIPSIDKLIVPLQESEWSELQPDLLITFGGMVVSKKIKKLLRTYPPKHHWHIDTHKANDTFFVLSQFFKQSVTSFFQAIQPFLKAVKSNYHNYWLNVMQLRRKKHDDYLNTIPYSDVKVFSVLLNYIPSHSQLQVSNSSTIRYLQLFDINPTLQVFCNRGTSGIDGSTSTAIGAAVATTNTTTFITGDLSFFYDSNALWNNYIPNTFRIIIINNGGGGIFRILPGDKDTVNFDTYFETVHHLEASKLCEMYHLEYLKVVSENDLDAILEHFYDASDSARVLEIFTPRTANDTVLLNYFDYLK